MSKTLIDDQGTSPFAEASPPPHPNSLRKLPYIARLEDARFEQQISSSDRASCYIWQNPQLARDS